jgi:DNA-binding winged helix-turn-helix (wHTH) protein/tetratricopeptide (TPR) repeat protein
MKAFHAFRLDTANHCLWRGEERLSLAPKAFDVLRYLVEHADRLVTQDEILEALWPETYVNPEVVKKYVLGIRKILGDQSSKPVFVATFPRRGYQFIAPVRDETASPLSEVATNGTKTIVGREGALAQLEDAFNKALQGQRQIVFITGEAGIGKTTLVDVFHLTAAFGTNVRIARGQCVEGYGGKEAYYPMLDAIGQLLRDPDGGPIVQAISKQAPTWLVQFPSMVKAEQREALQKEIIGATRERMVREICEALETISVQNPLVLCLEDLHWVDPSTLDFISALARRRGRAKLLLLGTYRPADVIVSQSPLKALKQDLVIHKLCHEVGLERLEESDIVEYLTLRFGDRNFPAGLANLIYRHSGGNALFMVTIVQDMVKKRLVAEVNGIWELMTRLENVEPNVPETLQQLIEVQFEQLDAVEQNILRSASVAGERFSVWAITTALEIEHGSIEGACEKLAERHQFIKAAGIHELANGEFSAHYEFRHSLYREVLYRRLSEVSRSKLHHVLGHRLEALCIPCEPELATALAMHFEEGREYLKAVRYLIIAAENAASRFAYRDSVEILQHALELVAKLSPALRAELENQILESIGDAHFALGAMAASAEAYLAAALRASQAGLRTALVRALTWAMCPLGFIDPDRGIAVLDQAVKSSASISDPQLSARTQMLAAGFRLVFDNWRQEDADLCSAADEASRSLAESDSFSLQQMTYAHVLVLRGRYREVLQIYDADVFRADRAGNLIAHFIAGSGRTIALLRMGHLGEVLRTARAGRALAEKNGTSSLMYKFREAWLRMLAFDFAGARQICDGISEAEAKVEPYAGQQRCIGRVAAGYMELHRGDYGRALEHFRLGAEREAAQKFFLRWAWRMTAQMELANTWLLAGNIQNARASADTYLQSALSTADPHLQALAWDLKTRVAMAENDWTGAREYVLRALAIVNEFEILIAAWQTHATAWQLYQHDKEHKTAETSRAHAEKCILKIANSFDPDELLRATFLAAAPIRRILSE